MRLIRKKRFLVFAVLLIVVFLLWHPVRRLVWSARVVVALEKLTQGNDGSGLPVKETTVSRQDGTETYEALCYSPAGDGAKSAIIITAGLSEEGCYHPGLVSLARTLAANGIFVITPDIKEFRELRISAEPIEQIAFWHRQVHALRGGEKVQKTGLAGVSYAGTLSLMAAARLEIQPSFVLAIGPYFDLIRCSREWFAAGDPDEWKGYYPTRFYARWILMRAALDMLPVHEERLFVNRTLQDLILSRRVPEPPPELTPEGLRWYRLAVARPGETDAELAEAIERRLAEDFYEQLNPEKALTELRAPLFLIHGEYDDLIPVRESVEIHQRVAGSSLFISPILTHTHPTSEPTTLRQKLGYGLDMQGFFYRLASVIN